MTYTFARVSAVVGLDVGDYFRDGYASANTTWIYDHRDEHVE
ncbi:hypothetical protein GGP73_003372 [Salinibacter ruber]|nr:hypothetical protein [Salinibacter ruber]